MIEWMTEADELLAGKGIKEAAELALMLGTWQNGQVAAFSTQEAGRVAWCRLDGSRLRCLAVAPDDGRRRVSEAEFFAKPFPDDWLTKRRMWPRVVPWPENGYAFGIMADGKVVLVRAAAGHLVQPSPDAPWMRREDHKAEKWHVLTWRLEGAARLFAANRVAFSGYPAFRLDLWRADDPVAAEAARAKAKQAAKASRKAKKAAKKAKIE